MQNARNKRQVILKKMRTDS